MITGSIVALVTPMHIDGSIDWQSLDKLIEFHITNGTQAIVSMGTTGESATLDKKEHCEVIKHTVKQVNKRIFVIAGTGANSTSEAIELSSCAKDLGVDALLLVTPYYNKPTQHGLFLHYQAIANAVDIKQILYNVPGRTACDMLPETIAKLSTIDNIIGVKEATGDLNRLPELIDQCQDGFLFYTGDDATSAEFLLSGGHGTISVTANIDPKNVRAMCDAAANNDSKATHSINEKIQDLHKHLFIESNPIPVKWVLHKMGLIDSGIRLPLTILSDSAQSELNTKLTKYLKND